MSRVFAVPRQRHGTGRAMSRPVPVRRVALPSRRTRAAVRELISGRTGVQPGLGLGAPDERDGQSLDVSAEPTHGDRLQRVVAIAGTDLDPSSLVSTQNEIVNTHLADVVTNASGNLLFSARYRESLIRDTVADMHESSERFNYPDVPQLARDVRQRVLVSLYMRQSQGRTSSLMGFSYPNRASDGTAGVGPRVNEAARSLWGPLQDPSGDYYFELSPAGRADAYRALTTLFVEQRDPTKRTLIHCDYLLSVLQYRAWAESIGVGTYNEIVSSGLHVPVLKWNGFTDLQTSLTGTLSSGTFTDQPLRRVVVANEGDLVIGDHVVFYNHESYDALIEAVGGIWRLENAILTDRRSGQNRYQGHGYFAPVVKDRLLRGMIRQYNRHVRAARGLTIAVDRAATPSARTAATTALHADYPNVVPKASGGWEISGTGLCGTTVTRDLTDLTMAEAPGLEHPCSGVIYARRPVHST